MTSEYVYSTHIHKTQSSKAGLDTNILQRVLDLQMVGKPSV